MASPGELIRTTAEVLGIDPVTVGNIYRGLREAGLVAKGGRGRSAIVVSPHDAAMLLFAICGSAAVKDAPVAAKEYAELQACFSRIADWHDNPPRPAKLADLPKWTLSGLYLDEMNALPVCHRAIDAVATFIALFAKKETSKPAKLILSKWKIEVGFEWPTPILKIHFYAKTKDGKHYTETLSYFEPAPGGAYYDARRWNEKDRERVARELAENGSKTRLIAGDLKVFRSFGIVTLSRLGWLIRGDQEAAK